MGREMILVASREAALKLYRAGHCPEENIVTPNTINQFEGTRWTGVLVGDAAEPFTLTPQQFGEIRRQLVISGVRQDDIDEVASVTDWGRHAQPDKAIPHQAHKQ